MKGRGKTLENLEKFFSTMLEQTIDFASLLSAIG